MRTKTIAALSAALLMTAGCATLARQAFTAPTVEVRDVKVRNIGLAGGTLDVTLDIQNPNEYRIDARKITYEFFVDTTRVVTGEIDRLVTLEERGVATLVVPVNFGFNELNIAMREYTKKGALDYRVIGQFTLVTPFGSVTRPYSGRGRVEGMP
ncbi:MAG: LEA type 2 family protein [Gemmatimonadaceae bacterium]|nr:LEA type 2 family protein [Gemmatimonadaceae bacterium]